MADNVAITPGAGATIATDDVGGVQFQRVKLDLGGDGVSAPVTTALPVSGAFWQTTQPVSLASSVAVTGTFWQATQPVSVPTAATTTRTYSLANAIRKAFTATSTAEEALPTLGATREVRFAASARCWMKWGATGLSAAAPEAASFVLEANSPEVVAIPAGATHFRVIRDTADGSVLMTPVA